MQINLIIHNNSYIITTNKVFAENMPSDQVKFDNSFTIPINKSHRYVTTPIMLHVAFLPLSKGRSS